MNIFGQTIETREPRGVIPFAASNQLRVSVDPGIVRVADFPTAPNLPTRAVEEKPNQESLFEHFAWLYVFCRERLFRDDTERIIRALWPQGEPPSGKEVIELGCGPGFYSCELARRFPQLRVLGVDQSLEQLRCAERKACTLGLPNVRFAQVDVLEPSRPDGSFDALLASRLFTVLSDRSRAVAEIFRVLRSGGRCLIAEPRYAFWASLPLLAMWCLAGVTRFSNGYREPRKATVMSTTEFKMLLGEQPWKSYRIWRAGRYHYALCEKG